MTAMAHAALTPLGSLIGAGTSAGVETRPLLDELQWYWDHKRGTRDMPARTDLDPVEMRKWLPNTLLVDIQHDPQRMRYRLIGTALVDALGQDLTGRYIDEMPFWYRKFAEPAYTDVLAHRAPHYRRINTIESFWIVKYDRLLLPLSSDGSRIDMVMGALYRLD